MVFREDLDEASLVALAQGGDQAAFERLTAGRRRELLAHCYRMLGSVHDAEDALQEALLGAWRGIAGFEGRSSFRSWMYRICTNACLRLIDRRPPRLQSPDYGPPLTQTDDLGQPVPGPVWLEPWPDDLEADAPDADPAASYLRRNSVELAYVAALQHLPGTQRAVLILREVIGLSAAEAADVLDTTPTSVNSTLQRARTAVDRRVPAVDQQVELDKLGKDGQRALVDAFVAAWERADVPALLSLLAEDARFTMPPLPAWFSGRDGIGRFVTERMFASAWRLEPIHANGQLAFACYQADAGSDDFRLGAINVLTLRDGLITTISAFLDPDVRRRFGLAERLPEEKSRRAR